MTLVRLLLLLFVIVALAVLAQPDDAITLSYLTRAAQYQDTQLYRLADSDVRVAASRQPWNPAIQLRLAELARLRGDVAQAALALSQAAALGANPIDLAIERALIAEDQQRFEAAAAHWQIVADARATDIIAPRRVVEAYIRAENWIAALDTAQHYAPRLDEAALLLGKLSAFDHPVEAQAHFTAAISDQAQDFLRALSEPDTALRAMLLGRLYLGSNDLTLALRAFEAALAANEAYAEAYAYAGFVRDQLGRDGGAQLDRAVALNAELPIAYYFRARHAAAAGDLDRAVSDLNQAQALAPQNALIAAELGRVQVQRGDLAAAEEWLIRARDLQPDDVLGWLGLAELYAGRAYGAPEQAVTAALEAVSRAPFDAEAHVWLGAAYLLSGDRAAAEAELQRAVALDARLALAQLYLGRLYGRNTPAGEQAYERALALDPDGPIGAQAKRTLELP